MTRSSIDYDQTCASKIGSILLPPNLKIVRVRVRGLKVNEGVTGSNVALFLHRSTWEKKSTLTFKFYPVTKNSTDLVRGNNFWIFVGCWGWGWGIYIVSSLRILLASKLTV